MMKRFSLLLLVLLLCLGAARAENNSLAIVQASTGDRVHLRAEADAEAASRGLYFTGTPVLLPEGWGQGEWVSVIIGLEKGYIRSDLLVSADTPVQPRWKQAQVAGVNGWLNLRSAPGQKAPVLARLPKGDAVTVLGETAEKWCFVEHGGQYGYVMAKFLRVSREDAAVSTAPLVGLPFPLPMAFTYSSGAGAWSSEMTLLPDGRFWGYYHDSEMGSTGKDHPNGTRYESMFTGTVGGVRQVGEWEYQLQVESLQTFGEVDQRWIEDGVQIILKDSAGVAPGEVFSLYLPDTPEELLPEDARQWRRGYAWTGVIPAVLVGHTSGATWCVE